MPRPPANLDRWERLARSISEEHGVYVVVTQLVGFEGGKGFAGGSVLAEPAESSSAEGPIFEPAIITATLDFDEITRARADQPLLSDLEAGCLTSWRAGSAAAEASACRSGMGPPRRRPQRRRPRIRRPIHRGDGGRSPGH